MKLQPFSQAVANLRKPRRPQTLNVNEFAQHVGKSTQQIAAYLKNTPDIAPKPMMKCNGSTTTGPRTYYARAELLAWWNEVKKRHNID